MQGLGKTLQASCIMASALADQAHAAHGAVSTIASQQSAALCLVVCPSTLVQHWVHEVGRFLDPTVLRPMAYTGSPAERQKLQVREVGKGGRVGRRAEPPMY